MKQLPAVLGWLLLIISFSIYLYGICYAIFFPIDTIDPVKHLVIGVHIPEPLDSLTSTIGAILLTNLGAVLGISITNPSSGLANKTLINNKSIVIVPPLDKRELIQYTAVIIYLIVLTGCFITWALHTFLPDDKVKYVVALVAQNGKNLIGVVAAYIAFVLGVKQS